MNKPDEVWGIVSMMGHRTIAGKISEHVLAGHSFIRVDIPATDGQAPFSKLLGPSAIYEIDITDRVTAEAAANYYKPVPMDKWTVRELMQGRLPVTVVDVELET